MPVTIATNSPLVRPLGSAPLAIPPPVESVLAPVSYRAAYRALAVPFQQSPLPGLALEKNIERLRKHNLYNSLAKEVLGSSIPRILLGITPAEKLEQLVGQTGWTSIHTGAGLVMDKTIEAGASRYMPQLIELTHHQPALQRTWWLGKSLAVGSTVAGLLMALPNVKNALMAQWTGKTGFSQVVGLKPQAPESADELKEKIQHSWQQARAYTLGGLATSVGLLGGTAFALKKGLAIPEDQPLLQKIANVLTLPEGKYSLMKDTWAIGFWGVPGLVGQWRASRDSLEKQEVALGAAVWLTSFTMVPRLIEKQVGHWAQGRYWPGIGGEKNIAWLGQLVSSVGLYTLIPQGIALMNRQRQASSPQET